MDTFKAIETRRSIKHYDENHEMSDDEVNKLMSLALLSPTSFNIQNWRFVLVQNKELRQKIKEAAWNQDQIITASLCIILCADLKSFKKEPERYWRNAPENVQKRLVPMIVKSYEGNDELQRDEAMRSVGIAGQTIMLAAKAMGYDSCPMIGYDPKAVAQLIKLPEDHVTGMIIVVGKSEEKAHARGGQLDMGEIVFTNHF